MSKLRFFIVILVLSLFLSYTSPAVQAQTTNWGKSAPTNGATVGALSVTLTWNTYTPAAGTGTVTYRYCLQTKKTTCPPGRWVRVGTKTTVTLRNLKPGTTYNWWVRAYDSKNNVIAKADNDNYWSFTTLELPVSFNKLGPSSGLTEQPINGVSLTWDTSTNTASTTFEVCFDTTNNNNCDTQWIPSTNPYTLNGLSTNAVYYWQVRAVNGSGYAYANGGWWQFTTTILTDVFDKIAPANNAMNQLATNLGLSWMISQGADHYEYCLSTQNNLCPNGVWTNVLTATSTVPSNTLLYDTDYYWQVRAVYNTNEYRYANKDAWWHFKTQVAPPKDFGKSSPKMPAQNLYTDVDLTWDSSLGTNYYEVCYSTIPNDLDCTDNSGIWEPVTDLTNLTYQAYGLVTNKTYYWQVRATNDTSTVYADGGNWWSFTTQPNPPTDFGKTAPTDGLRNIDLKNNVNLIWSSTNVGSGKYEVCIDTTNNNACEPNNWISVNTNTTYSPPNLKWNTVYYWQVRATNSGGTTYADGDQAAWFTFTTAYKLYLPIVRH